MENEYRKHGRYIAVAAFFCAICLAFVSILAVIQITGTSLPPREDGYTRTYTVPGIRGEIYDKNGVKLVGNSDKYDLIYEYGAMPDTRAEVNRSLLDIMAAIKSTGNTSRLSKRYFVLEGSYPEMTFTAAAKDKNSNEFYYYEKFLTKHKLNMAKTNADDIQNYFVKRYKLSKSLYSNEEITELICLYYEMERVNFGQYESYTIAQGINTTLITYIEEHNIEGVNFTVCTDRVYTYPGIASHILGTLGKIKATNMDYYLSLGYPLDAYVGVGGCEEAFEEYLRATDGIMVIKYDSEGNQIDKYYKVEPKSGNDVYLTIDIELQIVAEEALAENVADIDSSDSGAVTVLDPNTGKVLAIASNPTYDLSLYSGSAYYNSLLNNGAKPLTNRALSGVYSPGSTYKIGVALAALEGGYISENDIITCNHYFRDSNGKITGHTCLGTHGAIDVFTAIQESCNVFFFSLGEMMGIENITNYTYELGLGADTGLELNNKSGIVAGPDYLDATSGDPWYLGDTLNASIGQGYHGYTPLQLSVYMSSIVNGGTRYKATLLDSVRKYHSHEIILKTESEPLFSLSDDEYSNETENILKESMRRVIAESSNNTLKSYFSELPVTVGGKTGTSEVAGSLDYAIFCGFAPLDTPEIVISCILEEGEYGYRAAYTVGKIMEKYFEN